ncbi:hypothetical protein EB796_010237 [Bugula neritina]|uniref:Uncharacterized protein n=1 Tax=Bugula neritina TaxID=10212 RepID=A0A7J7K0G4_BUGNE|nr:hypothetical protein EB796_010237 [Bugula neritina]
MIINSIGYYKSKPLSELWREAKGKFTVYDLAISGNTLIVSSGEKKVLFLPDELSRYTFSYLNRYRFYYFHTYLLEYQQNTLLTYNHSYFQDLDVSGSCPARLSSCFQWMMMLGVTVEASQLKQQIICLT